jgi:hypothetical protein
MTNLKMVSNVVNSLHGDSINEKNVLFYIKRLYIVNIDITMAGANFVTSYYDVDESQGETVSRVWEEFADGHRSGLSVPRPSGPGASAFEIHFGRQPCHVMFVLEAGEWHFALDDAALPDVQETVVFRKNKAIIDYSSGAPITSVETYHENYSFYNLERIAMKNERGKNIDVIRFDNFMTKDQRGVDRINPRDVKDVSKFCMDLYLKIPLVKVFGRSGLRYFNNRRNAADGTSSRMPINFPFTRDNDLIIVFDPPQYNGGPIGPP